MKLGGDISGVVGRGRPRVGWRVEKDMSRMGFGREDASNRSRWREAAERFLLLAEEKLKSELAN